MNLDVVHHDLFERVVTVETPTDTFRILIDTDFWEDGDVCYPTSVLRRVGTGWIGVYQTDTAASEADAEALCRAWIAAHGQPS